jgi:hypothetical protein
MIEAELIFPRPQHMGKWGSAKNQERVCEHNKFQAVEEEFMKQTSATIRVGNDTRKAFVGLAIAIVASCVMLPVTAAAACSHQLGQTGGIFLPRLQWMNDMQAGRDARTMGSAPVGNQSIVGLWHVLLVSGGQPFDEGFDAWHSDGTEILVDNAPPQPANGAGTVCIGVFKKTGANSFKLKHVFWIIDANGNLAGSGVLAESVTVDTGGNSYHGSFKEDGYDLSGNLIFEVTGDLSADRITAD